MIDDADQDRKALDNARISYHLGNHSNTRYWAQLAIKINPNNEEPWLWLAAVSSPRASIAYLQKALSINPKSQRARQGMHWAIKRARLVPIKKTPITTTVSSQPISFRTKARISTASTPKSRPSPHLWVGIAVLLAVISCALVSPALGFYINTFFFNPEPLMVAQVGLFKSSNTPTPSNTPTITPSPTPTETPTPTPTDTPTPLPTDTPTLTFTPYPTDTDYPTLEPVYDELPEPGGDGRWIYVKYEYADMIGPGYYLPNVPYVMYFYDGYGLHGTYWHSNFGTPMSHGCINLTIPDSEWLFYWADIGTLVNIHE
jgi:hypothetical protein